MNVGLVLSAPTEIQDCHPRGGEKEGTDIPNRNNEGKEGDTHCHVDGSRTARPVSTS